MRRFGSLLLALALVPGLQAGGFGGMFKNFAKNKAKEEAKRRAKQEAAKAVSNAVGADVAGVVAGAVEGGGGGFGAGAMGGKGMAQMNAHIALEQAIGGQKPTGLAGLGDWKTPSGISVGQFQGRDRASIEAQLREQIMAEQGITKFSPRDKVTAANNLARTRAEEVLASIKAGAGGAPVSAMGIAQHLGKAAAEGAKVVGAQQGAEAQEAAGMLSDMGQSMSQGEMPDMSKAISAAPVDPVALRAQIEAEVNGQLGITRFSPIAQRKRAELMIEKKMRDAMGGN